MLSPWLGLVYQVLGLEVKLLDLGLGLAGQVLVNITANFSITARKIHDSRNLGDLPPLPCSYTLMQFTFLNFGVTTACLLSWRTTGCVLCSGAGI